MISQFISRLRRNHALEHATIHILNQHHRGFNAQGNAAPGGFYLNIYGEVPPSAVAAAAEEALARLQAGQNGLAIHPNCGTVLLTMATAATLAAQGTFAIEQKRLGRHHSDSWLFFNILPTAVLAVVFALIASRPLGMHLQTYTTDGRPGDLRIREVRELSPTPVAHFFRILLGKNKQVRSTSYFIATTG